MKVSVRAKKGQWLRMSSVPLGGFRLNWVKFVQIEGHYILEGQTFIFVQPYQFLVHTYAVFSIFGVSSRKDYCGNSLELGRGVQRGMTTKRTNGTMSKTQYCGFVCPASDQVGDLRSDILGGFKRLHKYLGVLQTATNSCVP